MKILFSTVMLFFGLTKQAQNLNIIPQPNSVEFKKGSLNLSENFSISTKGIEKDVSAFLIGQIHGNKTSISNKKGQLKLELIAKGEEEAYQLNINKRGITIRSASKKGLLNGIASLNQILFQSKKENGYTIPYVKIYDYPAYSYRGFMLDASRHIQSVEKVKKILDFMVSIKLNVFHWHLTDNEGWRIESKKFPRLNYPGSYMKLVGAFGKANDELNGYYTVVQIQEILKYAAERHIEVIPEIDIPGHNWAALTAYPEYRCPNHPGSNAFCGAREEGIVFVKEIFEEVISIFKSKYIHIGGDERKKGIWQTCPLDQAKMKKLGLESEDDLQNHYLNEITQYIHGKGVTTIAWAENLEEGIPNGQITQSWHEGEGVEALKKGHKIIVSDHAKCYLDYPENEEEKETKPGWMPILTVEKLYNFDFNYPGLTKEQESLIMGGECPLWTEQILEKDIYPQINQRIEAHAERSWSTVENKDLKRFRIAYQELKRYFESIIE